MGRMNGVKERIKVVSVSSKDGGKHDKGHVHVEFDIIVQENKKISPVERLTLFAVVLESMLAQYSERLGLHEKEVKIVGLKGIHLSQNMPEGGVFVGELDVQRVLLYPRDEAYESAIVTADVILLHRSREIMRAESVHFNIGVD